MEKIWLSSYPNSVPPEINTKSYTSLVDFIEKSCLAFSEREAFDNYGSSLTYRQFHDNARQFASYLQNTLGHKKGDRIAVMLPNCLQYPVVFFGILLAGGVVVNVNPLYTPRELEHQLQDAEVTTIIVLENFAKTLEQCLPKTSVKHVVVTKIGDLFPLAKGLLANFIVKVVKRAVPAWKIPSACFFKDALKQGRATALTPVKQTLDDLALLQYTGGTTGISKGAELTHDNLIANVLQISSWFGDAFDHLQQYHVMSPLPLYHIFALSVNLLTFLHLGTKNYLITQPRDLSSLITCFKKHKINVLTGVNTLFNALLNHPEFATIDFSTLKCSFGGGAAVQQTVAKRWKEITGCTLTEGYGLTECSPVVAINLLDNKEYSQGIGFAVSSTDISIRNEAGVELQLGEEGELCVRGPQVMRGYWRRPEETAKVFFKDGWLRTGDLAVMNHQGAIRLLERKKDMIIVSGFNVYPNEVEDVLAKHPGIKEVAVIGVPSDKSGEQVKAFVVKKDDSLTQEDVIAYARTELTGYKVPRLVEFKTELPKSTVGKILRRELR